jgi:predicted alpha/beta-fold hydrolase
MFLIAKDDPITKFNVVPMEDLERNPNFMVGITDFGGHCEFFYTKERSLLRGNRYGRKVPDVLLKYFSLVEQYK